MLARRTAGFLTLVAALSVGAGGKADSTITLPQNAKLVEGRVLLKVAYSCPATTPPEDALLWLYSTQDEPAFAAGDTAVRVICDGKRRKYRASLNPNIGETSYAAGTLFVEAFLGEGADTVHAHESAYVTVR